MANTDYRKIEEIGIEFTEEELRELQTAENCPVTFDEDCPETTPERAVKFKRVNPGRVIAG